MTTLGERLKNLRDERNLTQEDIYNKFHLRKSSLSKYEHNKQNPPLDMLNKFADFYNVSTDYLLGRTNIREVNREIVKNDATMDNILNNSNIKLTEQQQEKINLLLSLLINSLDTLDTLIMLLQLSERDQAKIEGKIEDMLESDKYTKKGQELA